MNKKLLLFLTLVLGLVINLKAKTINNGDLYFDIGSEWSFLDNGIKPTEDWSMLNFDDSSWKKGNGFFGFGYGDEVTLLAQGQSNYYFRKKIVIEDPNNLPGYLHFGIMQEQNVILRINNVEVFHSTNFSKSKKPFANKIKNTSEYDWYYYDVNTTYFIEGENIITIEILNNNQESSKLSFDCFFIDPPIHTDGPYVFYTDNEMEVVKITDNGIERQFHALNDEVILTVQDPTSEGSFSFPLKKEHYIPEAIHTLPTKLFVTSDIEGQFGAYKRMLIDAKVMNENFEWIYGDGYVVLSGDMVDRGDYVTEVLWLTYKLEQEAEKAGGKVQFVLGNHEVMVINNDVRYVHDKYIENIVHLKINYSDFFSKQSELGRWLRKKNIIEKVGEYTFVHGGVSSEVANLGLSYEEMNDFGRNRLNQESCRGDCRIVTGRSNVGIYWYRGIGKQLISQEEVNDIITKIKSDKLIIGHTKHSEITPLYQNKVIAVDINHDSNFKKHKVEALVFENNCFKRFVSNENGIQKTDLLNECDKLSTSDLKSAGIKIYPNPTSDWVHIELNHKNHEIEVYDLTGKRINLETQFKPTTISINTSILSKGVYLLKISNKTTKEVYQKKIIKK